jgi:hypothetical protein
MSAIFPVNVSRFDPYKTYRFLVYFGGGTAPVAAVSKVGPIRRSSEVIEYREEVTRSSARGSRGPGTSRSPSSEA